MASIHWSEGQLEANGVQLAYRRAGAGRPLVLAHGFSESASCWGRLGDALAATFDVVAYDARGHGRSEATPTGYDSATRATDLAQLIGALRLERPALLGHSMGAATAALTAAAYPQLISAIVLEDPPWPSADERPSLPDPEQQQALQRSWLERLERTQRRSIDELIERQRRHAPTWSDADLHDWAEARLQCRPAIVEVLISGPRPWQDVIVDVRCPILVLYGDRQRGGLVTPEVVAAMQALAPQTTSAYIPGAGHELRRDQPEAVINAARTFLRGLSYPV